MKNFIRTKEDFICENCNFPVIGDGYTNHCPVCLYSKHVDIHPGDRRASCFGLMEPIDFEIKKGIYVIIHKCQKCGYQKKNKTTKNDNLKILLSISQNKI